MSTIKDVQNCLTEDTTIKGNITTASSLTIAGVVEGDINAGGDVGILGDGHVRGDVSASHVRVEGRVEGRITATGRLLITASGIVIGDVNVGSLLIEEGGTLQGQCSMGREQRQVASSASKTVNGLHLPISQPPPPPYGRA